MKKITSIIAITLSSALVITSCKKSSFEDAYRDPSKIVKSSIEKQFTGLIYSNIRYVVPSYDNYFIVQRTSVKQYTQAVGFINEIGQYIPPAAGVSNRWANYYNFFGAIPRIAKNI